MVKSYGGMIICSKSYTKIPNRVISYIYHSNCAAHSKFAVRRAVLNCILDVKFTMRSGCMFQVDKTRLQKMGLVI